MTITNMEMELGSLIKCLNLEKDVSKRLAVYKTIEADERFVKNSNAKFAISEDNAISLIDLILADLTSENEEYLCSVLNVLGFLLALEDKGFTVNDTTANDLLERLIEILTNSKSSCVVQKVIHILASQHISESVMDLFIESFLTAVSVTGTSADNELIKLVYRFLEQCPKEMEDHVVLWLRTLLELSCHKNVTTRQLAVTALQENLKTILKVKSKILAVCLTFLKEDILPNLKAMCMKEDVLQEILSLQIPIYLSIMGEDYRRSSNLGNSVLQIVEKGFRHAEERIKVSAFEAWSYIIQCFANNKELLASSKYVKLLTKPLMIKAKTEAVTKAMIVTMWKLTICLDDILPGLFEMLCAPLLEICFGGNTSMQARRSSGRMSLSKQLSPYENVQVLGAEMLVHLLFVAKPEHKHSFYLDPLHKPFIGTPAVFSRFYATLIPLICDTICFLHKLLPPELLLELWNVLLRCTQDNVTRKRETEMFRALYQSAHKIVTFDLPANFLLDIVCSLISFPNKILNSSLYYSSGSAAGAMHGTPILSVLELLVCPSVYHGNMNDPKFLSCMKSVIACGMERNIGTLEFVHAVVNHLVKENLLFLKIWTNLCDHTTAYIVKTKNVNEGDSLEHDFSSLYATLLFPLEFVFNYKDELDNGIIESVSLSWSKLFENFSSCASKISSTKPNEVIDYLASHFLSTLLESPNRNLQRPILCLLEATCFAIVNNARFIEAEMPKRQSRQKLQKKSNGNSCKLSGFNLTVATLIDYLGMTSSQSLDNPTLHANAMPCVKCIFENAPPALVKEFFTFLMEMLTVNLTRGSNTTSNLKDLEDAWKQVLLRLPFEQSLFDDDPICELLIAAFSHSSSAVYIATVDFWEMKVIDVLNPNCLPMELLAVLSTVYKKQGFKKNWEDFTAEDEIELNVSITSSQSLSETENEVTLPDDVISESDITGESSILSANGSDDDITQLDQTFNIPKKINDQIPQAPVDECTAHSTNSQEEYADKPLSAKGSSSDTTATDSSPEDLNKKRHSRSLSLRPLAISQKTENDSSKVQDVKINEDRRQSARLRRKSKPDTEEPVAKKKPTSGNVVVNGYISSTDVIDNASPDRKLNKGEDEDPNVSEEEFISEDEEESCEIISDDEADATNTSDLIVVDSDESYNEHFVSACDGIVTVAISESEDDAISSPITIKEYDATETDFDVTRTTENESDVTIDADVSLQTENKAQVRSKDLNESELDISNVDKSVYEFVEMAEMSINPGIQQDSICENEAGFTDTCADKSIYEDVEMAEMSINPDTQQDDVFVGSDEIEDQNTFDDSTVENNDVDKSIYEVVEMAEMSICPASLADDSTVNDAMDELIDSEAEKSLYEIVEMAEMSFGPDTKLLINSANQGDEEISDCEADCHETDFNDANTDQETDVDLSTGNIDKSVYEEVEMAEMSINPEQQACMDKSKYEESGLLGQDARFKGKTKDPAHCVNSGDKSFDECVQDLGVHPLDNSFEETAEPVEHLEKSGRLDSNEKENAQPPTTDPAEVDVITNSQNDIISDKRKLNEHGRGVTPLTPLRRSSRNRVSTPKVLHDIADHQPKTRKTKRLPTVGELVVANANHHEGTDSTKITVIVTPEKITESKETETSVLSNEAVFTTKTTAGVTETNVPSSAMEDRVKETETPSECASIVTEEYKTSATTSEKDITGIKVTNMMNSPQTSGQEIESNVTPKSCLGKRLQSIRHEAAVSPLSSPSGQGILKRRVADLPSPATKSRRVSFAEPISSSTVCENETIPLSPVSSPRDWKKKKFSHRVVNRRLSLPAPKRTSVVPRNDETRSPMSVRSATVAAAIADIKARNADGGVAGPVSPTDATKPSGDDISPIKTFTLSDVKISQLSNTSFLKSLSTQQLDQLTESVLQAAPILHSVLMHKLKKT